MFLRLKSRPIFTNCIAAEKPEMKHSKNKTHAENRQELNHVAWYCSGYGAGLAINRSRVPLPAAALPSSDPGQVVHACPAPLKLRPYGAIEIRVM